VCFCGRRLEEVVEMNENEVSFRCRHCGRIVKIPRVHYEAYLREKDL